MGMTEENGGRKVAVLENDIEWIKDSLDVIRECQERIDSRLDNLIWKVAGIGGVSGLLTSLMVMLLSSHIL